LFGRRIRSKEAKDMPSKNRVASRLKSLFDKIKADYQMMISLEE